MGRMSITRLKRIFGVLSLSCTQHWWKRKRGSLPKCVVLETSVLPHTYNICVFKNATWHHIAACYRVIVQCWLFLFSAFLRLAQWHEVGVTVRFTFGWCCCLINSCCSRLCTFCCTQHAEVCVVNFQRPSCRHVWCQGWINDFVVFICCPDFVIRFDD